MPRSTDSTLLKRLSANFGRILKEKAVSGRQLALQAGISHTVIVRMLNEECEPALSTIEKLCLVLDVEISDVIRESPKRSKAAI
jgi:DNA-binding Xre family transcriptional regulator